MHTYEAIVVGAGAAGIGIGAALQRVGVQRFKVVDRGEVGMSFLRWPRETRFISPSFTTNGFGMPDLNAVTPDSSPAFVIRRSHMSGPDYSSYLRAIATNYQLPVESGVDVRAVRCDGEGFVLETSTGALHTAFVVWAAGEHGYPCRPSFDGAELCLHTGEVRSYGGLDLRQPVVIGGFESGIDAAVHLARRGSQVHVVDRGSPWTTRASDPSEALSPFTMERLSQAMSDERIVLHGEASAVAVERHRGRYVVHLSDGRFLESDGPPVLATGYEGSLNLIQEVFGCDDAGRPVLTEEDESARSPGLFLAGPKLHHRGQKFCYIYKFRQRFAVVAACIADRLGYSYAPLDAYADANMWLEDLSCCDVSCAC